MESNINLEDQLLKHENSMSKLRMQTAVDKNEMSIEKSQLNNDTEIKVLKEIGKINLEKVDWDIKRMALMR